MKAAVYYAPGDIRIEDRPEPAGTDDNLVVEVKCCAICGTDLKLATVGNLRCHPPRIIGHEMAGRIVHTGKNAKSFSLGERVTIATTISCGKCRYCVKGLGNVCPFSKPISYDFDGAFAKYIAIPPEALEGGNVVKIPDSVGDDAAALSEPISCAVNAQEIAGVGEGETVLILGGGPLGAINAETAKAFGASEVVIVQRSEPRLSMLRRLKGITAVNGMQEMLQKVLQEKTGGLGFDRVIVCAPSNEAQEKSLSYARKGGSISLFASLPKETSGITLDSRLIHYGELRITGASDSRPEHVKKALGLIRDGMIDTESIITHRLSLNEFHTGIELMKNKQCLKVMIYP